MGVSLLARGEGSEFKECRRVRNHNYVSKKQTILCFVLLHWLIYITQLELTSPAVAESGLYDETPPSGLAVVTESLGRCNLIEDDGLYASK